MQERLDTIRAQKQRLNAVRTKKAEGERGWGDKFGEFAEGAVTSGLDLAYGLMDLTGFGDVQPEELERFAQRKEKAGETGYGQAGRVAGELAQLVAPAGALTKALKVAKMGRAAPVVADIAAGAGLGAARLPSEGDSRLQSAVEEAAAGAAGGVLAKTLTKPFSAVARGVKRTPEADELIKQGVQLTPGQAAQSRAISGLEAVGEVLPVVARGTKGARKQGVESWGLKILNEANPLPAKPITKTGTAGGKQLKQNVEQSYKNAWAGAEGVNEQAVKRMGAQIDAARPKLDTADAADLTAIKKDIAKLVQAEPTTENLRAMDNVLRRRIKKTADDRVSLLDEIQGLRDTLRGSTPEPVQAELKRLDANYPNYLTALDAIAKGVKEGGEFTPSMLAQSVKKTGKTTRTGTGEAPLQDEMLSGMATVGREGIPTPLSRWLRFADVLSVPTTPSIERFASRLGTGETAAQRIATKGLDSDIVQALRRYSPSGARLGSAIEE